MSFFSRLFGRKEASSEEGSTDFIEDPVAFIERLDAPMTKRGADIADDVVAKLESGKVFRVSNIEAAIKSQFPSDPRVVMSGFRARLIDHLDSGAVLLILEFGGDRILVHKDHVDRVRTE